RTDLLVIWKYNDNLDSTQKIVIELKLLYKSLQKTIKDGVKQTLEYMDRCSADEGHLIIFDRTEGKAWEEKIFRREEKPDSSNENGVKEKKVVVWGM
ncbi:MAG: ATP-binding protein, partial [Desulfamplus sp.]|nr:ATP-binding protein [Desulfamplus sp.]